MSADEIFIEMDIVVRRAPDRGTPRQQLHDAGVAAMNDPTVQKRFKENGIDLVGDERRSSAYLIKFVTDEIAKWAGPIKSSGSALE